MAQTQHSFSMRTLTLQDFQQAQAVESAVFSPVAFATYIRSLRQNWRQGTVGCKTRGELSFSNKKPWRQKGTGRARVSSLRSPLWRKGGIIFGPQPRVRTLKVSRKAKIAVLQGLFYEFVKSAKIVSLSWMSDLERPKTSMAVKALKAAGFADKRVVVFMSTMDLLSQASFANIPNVQILLFDQANAYDLANASAWIFFQKDEGLFKDMVGRWL